MPGLQPWGHLGRVVVGPAIDLVRYRGATLRLRTALAAENLFLRKPWALSRERPVRPRQASASLRLTLLLLARCVGWREALTSVQPATLRRWHRDACQRFWRWRSRPGRPRLSAALQQVMATMARDNPTGGEERIAAAFLVERGIRGSPRTVHR